MGNTEWCFLPSARCHSTPLCPSAWSLTGYICTLHQLQKGRSDCVVGSSAGNPEHCVPIAQPCNRWAERRRQDIFPSGAEEYGGGWDSEPAMCSTCLWQGNTSKSVTKSLLVWNSRRWAGSTGPSTLRIVTFTWHATWRCPGWCNLIGLSHQLCQVIFCWNENSMQRKGVFSGIVKDSCGVEFTLQHGTNAGGGPAQPRVEAHDTFR